MESPKNLWVGHPPKGWVKMESRSPGGIVVHWVYNTVTGAAADFKLK